MRKKYRKITVKGKEFEWLYKYNYYISEVLIFDYRIEYDLLSKTELKKRRYLKTFDVTDFVVNEKSAMKPSIVEHLILNDGIDKQGIRKLKLKKINKDINESKNCK